MFPELPRGLGAHPGETSSVSGIPSGWRPGSPGSVPQAEELGLLSVSLVFTEPGVRNLGCESLY